MNKKILAFLRFVLILATILVMTYSKKGLRLGEPGYIIGLVYFLSNFALYWLPERYYAKSPVSFGIFFFDIVIISAAIYFTQGVETDFYLIYFLAIFISSVGQGIRGSIPIAIVASAIYTWLMLRSEPSISIWNSKFLMRIPFLFIVSLISSYWSASTRRELKKKDELERFNRELKIQVERVMAKEVELRRYSEKIIDKVASGIVAVNRDGIVITINPEAERAFHIAKDEMVGFSVQSMAHLHTLWLKMKTAMDEGKPILRDEVTIQSKAGHDIPIGFNVTPLDGTNQEISGCVVIFKDLSEIRKLEDMLKHGERLSYLGKMASWVAHEIRNPLTSIDGFAQLLQQTNNLEKMNRYVVEIRKGAKRINHIVDDILTFARAKKVESSRIDLRVLIESILKEVKIDTAVGGFKKPLVRGEEESIRRLFINLISNSIEAMEEHGKIEIWFDRENGMIITHVKDTGKGIPKKYVSQLFQPFFTTKPRGTGLGLAIVKKIIDEHGGQVTIDSEEGVGTECRVKLSEFRNEEPE